jgi:RNA polymerase sigma-70 factor (ECF subfamily)
MPVNNQPRAAQVPTEETTGHVEIAALLLRAARFEVGRRGEGLPEAELEEIAHAAADAAWARLLPELSTQRADGRAWVAKFAVVEAAVRMRRRRWRGRPLPEALAAPALIARLGDGHASVALAASIEALPDDERRVLIALTLDEVPIDVLAERDGVSRAEIYATLQAARAKLCAELAADSAASVAA